MTKFSDSGRRVLRKVYQTLGVIAAFFTLGAFSWPDWSGGPGEVQAMYGMPLVFLENGSSGYFAPPPEFALLPPLHCDDDEGDGGSEDGE